MENSKTFLSLDSASLTSQVQEITGPVVIMNMGRNIKMKLRRKFDKLLKNVILFKDSFSFILLVVVLDLD